MTCIIKETEEGESCGKDTFTSLTTSYTFDTDERFDFRLDICQDHYEALVERYRGEFKEFSIGSEE